MFDFLQNYFTLSYMTLCYLNHKIDKVKRLQIIEELISENFLFG